MSEHCPVCDHELCAPPAWREPLTGEAMGDARAILKTLLTLAPEQRAAVLLTVLDTLCGLCGEKQSERWCIHGHTRRDQWLVFHSPARGYRSWLVLSEEERESILRQYPLARSMPTMMANLQEWFWYCRRPLDLSTGKDES